MWVMLTLNDNIPPASNEALDGRETYRAVRAHFVMSGTTFNKWCKENGISRTYAEKSIKGERNGPIAIQIRNKIYSLMKGVPHG